MILQERREGCWVGHGLATAHDYDGLVRAPGGLLGM